MQPMALGGSYLHDTPTRHDLLIAYWHVVHDQVDHAELGPDWAQRRRFTDRTPHPTASSANSNNSATPSPCNPCRKQWAYGPKKPAGSPDSHLSVSTGHAFVQNLRRGHYELAVDLDPNHRIPAAFTELALAI
jgi:hypothetical protein